MRRGCETSVHLSRHRKLALAGSLALLATIVPLGAVPAYASEATGNLGYYGPVDGISYWNQNGIINNGGSYQEGYIAVGNQVNSNVPTGYLGGLPETFSQAGVLCLAGAWNYNGSPVEADFFYTKEENMANNCGGPGYFYSWGESRAYNGNGYYTYSSFKSPVLYMGS